VDKMKEKIDLDRPSINTVRHHNVGRFYNLSENKGIRSIKSLTLPRWLKLGRPKKFSIDEEVLDLLDNDKTKSKRHNVRKPKWVPGRNGKKGHFLCHVRTPNGKTKWVNGKIAKERYNRRSGRKEGGRAYKIRREIWRVLARYDNGRRLLLDDSVWKKTRKERKCVEISCNIVELSLALEEFLLAGLFENGKLIDRTFALKWYRKRKSEFEQELDDEEAIGWIQLNAKPYVSTICKSNWGAILSQLVETAVFQRKHKPLIDKTKGSNDEDLLEHTVFLEHMEGGCEDCGLHDWEYDSSRGETLCGHCGLVTKDIELDGHSHHFLQKQND
jgi:hypothetical protein